MQSGAIASLPDLYANTIETIGWASLRVQTSVTAFDRFPDVLPNGRTMIEANTCDYLGV